VLCDDLVRRSSKSEGGSYPVLASRLLDCFAALAMTGRGRWKPHPVIARSSCDDAIQCFCVRRTEESALRRPRPQKLEERRRKLSSPCFAKCKNGRKWNPRLAHLFLPITERLAKRLNRDFLRGGGESSSVIPRRAIAHRGMTAITLDGEAPTQKPAAPFCGRVLGGAIDCEQNTTTHRTSQASFDPLIHRQCTTGRVSVRMSAFAPLRSFLAERHSSRMVIPRPLVRR
jgi:hypothetical protein